MNKQMKKDSYWIFCLILIQFICNEGTGIIIVCVDPLSAAPVLAAPLLWWRGHPHLLPHTHAPRRQGGQLLC